MGSGISKGFIGRDVVINKELPNNNSAKVPPNFLSNVFVPTSFIESEDHTPAAPSMEDEIADRSEQDYIEISKPVLSAETKEEKNTETIGEPNPHLGPRIRRPPFRWADESCGIGLMREWRLWMRTWRNR